MLRRNVGAYGFLQFFRRYDREELGYVPRRDLGASNCHRRPYPTLTGRRTADRELWGQFRERVRRVARTTAGGRGGVMSRDIPDIRTLRVRMFLRKCPLAVMPVIMHRISEQSARFQKLALLTVGLLSCHVARPHECCWSLPGNSSLRHAPKPSEHPCSGRLRERRPSFRHRERANASDQAPDRSRVVGSRALLRRYDRG